ncbi:hypothetical protein [uncultured Reyranella sp.]|uniref:hypothetical protein n=1 Tax=uncultured Reyranella sp. TaxID=735512 RepID=UPI0025FCFC6A|nr:hypothetical protein [uncultured Reyranella sp.]
MAMFIIFTSAQADLVRGPSESNPAAALNPIERTGSAHILGLEVLSDPAHEPHWSLLGSLPQLDSADPAFPAPLDVEES